MTTQNSDGEHQANFIRNADTLSNVTSNPEPDIVELFTIGTNKGIEGRKTEPFVHQV